MNRLQDKVAIITGQLISVSGGTYMPYRTPQGGWTNVPVITGNGMVF